MIQYAAEDGVSLALSPAGTLKAAGDGAMVSRWLPLIREQKPGIVAALQRAANEFPMSQAQETAIRAWLDHIEEDDPAIIAEVLDKCRTDPEALAYFSRRAEEVFSQFENGR